MFIGPVIIWRASNIDYVVDTLGLESYSSVSITRTEKLERKRICY